MRLVSARINLFVAAAGAGLLSVPWLLAQSGWAAGLALFVILLASNFFMALVILETGLCTGTYTFDAAVSAAFPFSRLAYPTAIISIIIGCMAALTGYTELVADILSPLLSGSSSLPPAVPAFAFSLLVAWPLSSFPRLASLAGASLVSIAALLVVAVCVLLRASAVLRDNGIDPSVQAAGAAPQVLLAGPIVCYALANQYVLLPVLHDVSSAGEAIATFPRAVLGALVACASLYVCVGLGAYCAWGTAVHGSVLSNLTSGTGGGTNDALSIIAQVAMCIHVLLAYPVIAYPLRQAIAPFVKLPPALHRLFPHWCGTHTGTINAVVSTEHATDIEAEHEDTTAEKLLVEPGPLAATDSALAAEADSQSELHLHQWVRVPAPILSLLIVLLVALLAVLLPGIQVVFGLCGAILGFPMFLLPAAMALQHARAADGGAQLHFLPASPSASRAIAALFVLLSLFIGAAGTVGFIRDTWFS